jgi:hypothetical protein
LKSTANHLFAFEIYYKETSFTIYSAFTEISFSIDQGELVSALSIAGVTRRVLWILQKLLKANTENMQLVGSPISLRMRL